MKTKYTILDMKKIAVSKNGFCLSEKYIDIKTHLKWQCDKGHIWEATPDKIRQGSWCPICARIK